MVGSEQDVAPMGAGAGVGGEPLYQMTKDAMGNAPKEGV